MLLHDPYAGHRKWWDWEWKPGVGDEAWTDWDYLLAKTLQTIEDYTNNETGQFRPYDESPDVQWDVQSSYSGSKAAIEKAMKDKPEMDPGETFYAVPSFDTEKSKPTLTTWVESIMEADGGEVRPAEAKGSRPPTPEELAELLRKVKRTVD